MRARVSAIVFLLATACTGGPSSPSTTEPPATRDLAPPASPTSAVPRSPTQTQLARGRLPRGARWLVRTGAVVTMEPTLDHVFVVVSNRGPGSQAATRILRIRLHYSVVTRSAPVYGGEALAAAGGSLWVSGPAHGPPFLYRLDPHTLRVLGHIPLPEHAASMVDAPAGLWVGAGRHLYLLDPTDGVVRRRVRLHGQVDRIAADVRYRFLFVAMHAGIGDGLPLEERDASTGVLIRRAHGPLDFGANSLTPVFRGVWVSTSTGNFGAAFFYREANLSIARHRTIEGMQGIATQYSGGPHLWVLRRQLDPILTCADPDSGRIQGTFRLPDGYRFGYSDPTTAVSIANTVYVGTSFGVLRIKPSLCRPGAEG